jgi:hypothetical protein
MTTLIDDGARTIVSARARYFYFNMSLACLAVAFVGFAPTYWMPLAERKFSAPLVVHFHGILFFSWTVYVVFQTWLAASGQTARHRSVGMIGVSLATAMTIAGFLVAIAFMKMMAGLGQTDVGLAFSVVPLLGILFFAIVFVLAMVNVRRPEVHKRLILLASISILDAAVARWFIFFFGQPTMLVAILAAMVAYLLLVVPIMFDWRTRGRPHPVYLYGGLAMVVLKILNWPISATAAWHAFAGGILALAQ